MVNTIKLDSSAMDELDFNDLLGDKLFDGLDMDFGDDFAEEKVIGDMAVEALPTSVMAAAEEKDILVTQQQQQMLMEEEEPSTKKKNPKKKNSKKKNSKKKKKNEGALAMTEMVTLDSAFDSINALSKVVDPSPRLGASSAEKSDLDKISNPASGPGTGSSTPLPHHPPATSDLTLSNQFLTPSSNEKSKHMIDDSKLPLEATEQEAIWTVFPYKNTPGEVSLKRTHKIYPNLDSLSILINQHNNNQPLFSHNTTSVIRNQLTHHQNALRTSILPELSAAMSLLCRQYGFLQECSQKLDTAYPASICYKGFGVVLKVNNSIFSSSSDEKLVANIPTSQVLSFQNNFTTAITATTNTAPIPVNKIKKRKAQKVSSSNTNAQSSSLFITKQPNFIINQKKENSNQLIKQVINFLQKRACTIEDKLLARTKRRKLKHASKQQDLREIAQLEEVKTAAATSSSAENQPPIILNTLALHAWIDEAGYLEDNFTVEDIKEDLDLWQAPTNITDEYCYEQESFEANDEEQHNESLTDRCTSLLVPEDSDDETSTSSCQNDNSLNYTHYINAQATTKNNDIDTYLDVSQLSYNKRLYIQLNALDLIDNNDDKTSDILYYTPKQTELQRNIHVKCRSLSKLHNTNNQTIGWLQYVAMRHLSLAVPKKKCMDDYHNMIIAKYSQFSTKKRKGSSNSHVSCSVNGSGSKKRDETESWLPW